MDNSINNPEPYEWIPLSNETALAFAKQLRNEIPKRDHVLTGTSFVVVAKNAANDDVLLSLPDTQQWAWCHMTWSKRREKAPWPATRVYDTLRELMYEP